MYYKFSNVTNANVFKEYAISLVTVEIVEIVSATNGEYVHARALFKDMGITDDLMNYARKIDENVILISSPGTLTFINESSTSINTFDWKTFSWGVVLGVILGGVINVIVLLIID